MKLRLTTFFIKEFYDDDDDECDRAQVASTTTLIVYKSKLSIHCHTPYIYANSMLCSYADVALQQRVEYEPNVKF